MRRNFALALAAAITSLPSTLPEVAQAQYKFPCEAFQKNADGSWLVLKTTYIEGPNVKVAEDNTIQPGQIVLGYDIAAIIAKACPDAPLTSAPAAASPAQAAPAPQPPKVPLSKYADANGNIDADRLTCGHLDDASADEQSLLLAWFSGWYSGPAKRHTVNLARLRYATRNVVDYGKANRDKPLVKAMKLMLK